jgi:murein DD-endopeptidase MepM/ murein hydrolase activator NlpD
MRALVTAPSGLMITLLLASCGGGGGGGAGPTGGGNPSFLGPTGGGLGADACGGYPDQTTSPYVLPYEVGTSHRIGHGNCMPAGTSHQTGGTRQYAYDMTMDIGTVVVAARAGEVVAIRQNQVNFGPAGQENFVIITHDDGTHGRYFHITQNGSMVSVGQMVTQGQPIALSGSSGTAVPHLHFVVEPAGNPATEPHGGTPITFLNTRAHPNGLQLFGNYMADPYPGCGCAR